MARLSGIEKMNHADLVEAMATTMRDYYSLLGWSAKSNGDLWLGLAEAALEVLTCYESAEG